MGPLLLQGFGHSNSRQIRKAQIQDQQVGRQGVNSCDRLVGRAGGGYHLETRNVLKYR